MSDTTERLSMHAFTMLYITTPGLIYLITGSLYLLLITISEASVEVGLIKNWVPRDESTLTIVFQQLWERKGGLGPLLAVKYESIRKTPREGHHGISQLLPDPGEILFPANFAAPSSQAADSGVREFPGLRVGQSQSCEQSGRAKTQQLLYREISTNRLIGALFKEETFEKDLGMTK